MDLEDKLEDRNNQYGQLEGKYKELQKQYKDLQDKLAQSLKDAELNVDRAMTELVNGLE